MIRGQDRIPSTLEEGLDGRLARRRLRVDGGAGREAGDDAAGLAVGLAVRDGDGSLGADLAGGDAERAILEDEILETELAGWFEGRRGKETYGEQVDEAKEENNDSRANDQAPEWQTERLGARGLFVEISENVIPQNDHAEAEEVEAVAWAEERPVPGEVGLEDGTLGDEKEHYRAVSNVLKGNGENLLLERAVMTCVAPSKKKNLETVKVLTTMTMLAAMTASKQTMLIPRRIFRMMKPGPASLLLVSPIPLLYGTLVKSEKLDYKV